MEIRKAAIGAGVICAIAVSGFTAPAATALGTTAVTCEKVTEGTGEFSDQHCKSSGGSKEFKHVAFAANTATRVTASNSTTNGERQPWFMKMTIAGFPLIVEAKKVTGGLATIENKEAEGEMWAEGSGEILIFEEVAFTNIKCTMTGLPGGAGKIETHGLKGTTKGQGDALKYEPLSGTAFAEFEIGGAECPAAVKGKYPVVGSIKGTPSGSTSVFSHATGTAEKSLRLKTAEGPLVGLEGSTTTLAKDLKNEITGEWPLAATT